MQRTGSEEARALGHRGGRRSCPGLALPLHVLSVTVPHPPPRVGALPFSFTLGSTTRCGQGTAADAGPGT